MDNPFTMLHNSDPLTGSYVKDIISFQILHIILNFHPIPFVESVSLHYFARTTPTLPLDPVGRSLQHFPPENE